MPDDPESASRRVGVWHEHRFDRRRLDDDLGNTISTDDCKARRHRVEDCGCLRTRISAFTAIVSAGMSAASQVPAAIGGTGARSKAEPWRHNTSETSSASLTAELALVGDGSPELQA